MLIRLMTHSINNPMHIDKLICIKGLPDNWFFKPNVKYGGKELLKPWLPEIDENVPSSIRHLCESHEITEVFPPVYPNTPPVVDKRTIIGVRLDYMTEGGQTMWEKVERYIEVSLPRDQRIPIPVLFAPNQKSDFSPHEPRRNARGSLELRKAEVPVVDLRDTAKEPVLVYPINQSSSSGNVSTMAPMPVVVKTVVLDKKEIAESKCDQCPKVFEKVKALRMHKMKMHPKKEEVITGV